MLIKKKGKKVAESVEIHIYRVCYSNNNCVMAFEFADKKEAQSLFNNFEKLSLSRRHARINDCKEDILFSFVPGGSTTMTHIRSDIITPEYYKLDDLIITQINLKDFT